ncbi:MAG: calcium/sodium antiporter [Pseudomonadota bacterium]
MTYAYLALGLFILLFGGEILIRGAVGLSNRLKLSPVFVGVVVIGFGTSLPEMAVGVDAVMQNAPALTLGNAVGSNIANILFILATAALLKPFERSKRALFPDGFILVVASCGVIALGFQDVIHPWQGAVMLCILIAHMSTEYYYAQRKSKLARQSATSTPDEDVFAYSDVKPMSLALALAFISLGLIALLSGAHMLIDGASQIAREFYISEEVIGLSVLAIGTSLPELASAVTAALRGHPGMAYGNIFGSNLFNLLGILGVSSLVGTLNFPERVFFIDGPIMIAATLVMLLFFWTGKRLSRIEGGLMLSIYIAYIYLRYTLG